MKGLFIPDITAEMFRNGCLESIETLMADGEVYDIEYNKEPQWIPCSGTEDIPDHEVLCCDRYGNEMFGYLAYSDDQWLCENEHEMMYDPIAWREKPEPYQPKEEEG